MTNLVKHVATSKTYHLSLLRDVSWCLGDNVTCSTQADIDTLFERVNTRGLGILMDDLPDLCKLYEQALSSGVFDWDNFPVTLRRKNGSGYSKFIFGNLIGLSFNLNHPTSTDEPIEPDLVQSTRALLLLFKKVRMDSSEKSKSLARLDFKHLDEIVQKPSAYWNFESGSPSCSFADYYQPSYPRWLLTILVLMDRISGVVSPGDYVSMDDYKPKHGPGSVSDLRSGEDKYSFPSWPKNLSSVFPANGWASHLHDSEWDSLPDSWGDDPVSKLICVPKTLSKPRVIASEPVAMQYCQQAVMHMLRDEMDPLLKRIINFNSQDPSREQALKVSATRSHGTVDLSSASDRVSCGHVESLFKYNLTVLDALRATRTPYCDLGGEVISLNKFAAMGSATTFPVQSILYAVAALAVSYWDRFPEMGTLVNKDYLQRLVREDKTRITVFGDDIIVPSEHVVYLSVLFEALGLKVNVKKTHYRGFFRESCGMDSYAGVEVTPLYLAHIGQVGRSEVATTVEIRNNAYLKGYWNLAQALEDRIPKQWNRYIPRSYVALPSLRHTSFLKGVRYISKKRKWHSDHQSFLAKGFVVRSKEERVCRNDWGDLLQYFIEGSRDERSSVDYLDPQMWVNGWSSRNRTSFDVRWVKVH